MSAFTIQRIDHIVLRVASLEASMDFYCRALACSVAKRRDDLGLIHLKAGTSMIDLVAVEGPLGRRGGAAAGAEARNMDHVCLRVEHFSEPEIVRHLERHGIRPLGPATENFGAEGNGLSLYIHDPDGNLVELKGPSAQEPKPGALST